MIFYCELTGSFIMVVNHLLGCISIVFSLMLQTFSVASVVLSVDCENPNPHPVPQQEVAFVCLTGAQLPVCIPS